MKLSGIFARTTNVVMRSIAGETLLVQVAGQLADLQHVFVLDTVGRHIWDRLDGHKTLAQIRDELLVLFEVTPEQLASDLIEFVSGLEQAGLIERVGE